MKKFFCIMLFCLGAYSCEPADPAYMFLDFNDIDRDGTLNLDEWMACKAPPALKIVPDLCTSEEFKRLSHNGKVSIDELRNLVLQKISWQKYPCASWPPSSKNIDQNKSR
ncbi:EF-hand domain-containing protein [Campylobacter concisus]|uniref:GDP-mannose dehydrogenase n=1 Tax=Campylobacter concisus TaxID=199 RepID=UPI000D320A13|nr:GDP-mannose dehydrogenase [Campylobacter concisus]